MRPVDKSLYQKNEPTYDPYGDAKEDLIRALGAFCSYCERKGHSSALDVEHIESQHLHPAKEYDWDNFLLGCKNCNSIKKAKPIDFNQILLPHLNNTFFVLSYLEGGAIIVNSNLDQQLKNKTEKLMDLVGLDRCPGHDKYSKKDKRYQERGKVWNIAKRYLNKWNEGKCDLETIRDLALAEGFWSIWMTVFNEYPNVKSELIKSFHGTRSEFFGKRKESEKRSGLKS